MKIIVLCHCRSDENNVLQDKLDNLQVELEDSQSLSESLDSRVKQLVLDLTKAEEEDKTQVETLSINLERQENSTVECQKVEEIQREFDTTKEELSELKNTHQKVRIHCTGSYFCKWIVQLPFIFLHFHNFFFPTNKANRVELVNPSLKVVYSI